MTGWPHPGHRATKLGASLLLASTEKARPHAWHRTVIGTVGPRG